MFRSCLGVSSCNHSSVLFELHIVVANDASDILCAQDNSRHRHQTWTVFPFGGSVPIFHLMSSVWDADPAGHTMMRRICWMPVVAAVITQLLCYCWWQTAGTREGSLRVDIKSGCFVSLGKWPPTSICGCLVQPTWLCLLEVFSCLFKISFLITYIIFLYFFSFMFPLSV